MDNNPINLTDVMGDKTHGDGGDPVSHEVKKDETLGGIAKKYDGVSADDIYEANKELIGSDKDLIKPGQKLEIPGTKEVKEEIQIEKKEPGWSVKVPEPTTELSEGESKEVDTNSFLDMLRSVDDWAEDTMDPIAAKEMAGALGGAPTRSKSMDESMIGEPNFERKPAKWITEEPSWMKTRREEEQEAKHALMNGDYSDVKEKLDAYHDYYANKNRLYILTDYNLLINGKSAVIQDTGVAVKHYGDSMLIMLYSRDNNTNFGIIDTNVTPNMLKKYGSR